MRKMNETPEEETAVQEDTPDPLVLVPDPSWRDKEKVDWDLEIAKYEEKIESDQKERFENRQKEEKKENTWELMTLCKEYLEENSEE